MKCSWLLFFFFFTFSLVFAGDDFKAIDDLMENRETLENVFAAISLMEKQSETDTENIELIWRQSFAYYYAGHHTDEKKSQLRKDLFTKGIERGEKCVLLSKSLRGDCFFWLGTNLILLKDEIGIFAMAFNLSDIIKKFERALQLDPLYAGAGPYRILAQIYHKAPSFLGGSDKKANEYFEKSIELSPKEPLNYNFYAKFLVYKGEKEKAKKIALSGIANCTPALDGTSKMAINQKLPIESKKALEELPEILQNLK